MAIKTLGRNSSKAYKAVWDRTGYRTPGDFYYTTNKWYGSRGVYIGGWESNVVNTMDYFTIASTGNASDFGDLANSRQYLGATSNGSRGIAAGGYSTSIYYITIATTSNSSSFGSLTVQRGGLAAVCDGAQACWMGGYQSSAYDTIDYVTVSTLGDATDFGNLIQALDTGAPANDTSRGLCAAGNNSSGNRINTIDYITIATPGNAADFGDYGESMGYAAGCSSTTRGAFGGGHTGSGYSTSMYYVTIQTLGNANSFGGITQARFSLAGCSDASRGLFGGGKNSNGNPSDVVDYFPIDGAGSGATDFGNLSNGRQGISACAGT